MATSIGLFVGNIIFFMDGLGQKNNILGMSSHPLSTISQNNNRVFFELFRFFSQGSTLRAAFPSISVPLQMVFILSFLLFAGMIGMQSYLNF